MIATLGTLGLYGVDEFGVKWTIDRDRFAGWDDGAASTVAVVRKPRQRGGWAGAAFDAPAHYSIGGLLKAPSPAVMLDARDRLKAAASLDETTLTIVEEGVSRSAKVRREDQVLFKRLTPTVSTWSVQLVAPDPRKLGASLAVSTRLPSTTGGLTVPFTVPLTINAVTVTGQVSLTNPGNISGPVRLRIDGPVQGPVVTHVSSGRSLVFASSVVLGAGEFLTVDMERREVLANGQSSRNGWVTERGWSAFEPGDNVWAFTAVSYDAGAQLTVTATPAWQ